MNDEQLSEQTLQTLQEIRDRLPQQSETLEIRRDDQAALNANLEAIASGAARVVQAPTVNPTYGPEVKQISRTDQRALDANLDAIASGKAVVI